MISPERATRPDPESDLELREQIRARLKAAGFHRVGFASAGEGRDADSPGADRLRQWLRRGYHGEMHYLARNLERRCAPGRVLESTKSVIVAALDYRHRASPGIASPRGDRAEISCYARGTDYHRVLESRLKRACQDLRDDHPGQGFRYHVDTGPVLEKAWAEVAGVGWIGKNTCSIDREMGSFYFLAVILTTLDLPADPPATDHCGNCRLCIDACPTGAIVEPYVLDARRCISYLTIEHAGPIEPELEDSMANLVFGCDICQEVCPWNDLGNDPGKTEPEADPELAPRPENVFPPLAELAALDAEGFRERYPRSAVRRAKPRGFLRNVIIALGNSGEPELLEPLARLADREDVRRDPLLRASLERAKIKLEKEIRVSGSGPCP